MEPYPGGTSSDLEAMSGNTILGERSRRDHLFGKNKSPYATELIASLLSPEIERTRLGVVDCGPSSLLVAVLLVAQT